MQIYLHICCSLFLRHERLIRTIHSCSLFIGLSECFCGHQLFYAIDLFSVKPGVYSISSLWVTLLCGDSLVNISNSEQIILCHIELQINELFSGCVIVLPVILPLLFVKIYQCRSKPCVFGCVVSSPRLRGGGILGSRSGQTGFFCLCQGKIRPVIFCKTAFI